MSKDCHMDVTGGLHNLYMDFIDVLQVCYRSVTGVLQGYYMGYIGI